MNTILSLCIHRYLKSVLPQVRRYAFFELDQNGVVVSAEGDLENFGLTNIDFTIPIDTQIDSLVGLLPSDKAISVLINVRSDISGYVDIHLIKNVSIQWVVFIDRNKEGLLLQKTQQRQLESDLERESTQRHIMLKNAI